MKWISNCYPEYSDTFDDGTVMVKSSKNEPLRVHYKEVECNQKWWSPAGEKRIMKNYNPNANLNMENDEIQKLKHTTEKLIALQMAYFSEKTGMRISKMNVKVYKTHPNAKLGFEGHNYVYSVDLEI